MKSSRNCLTVVFVAMLLSIAYACLSLHGQQREIIDAREILNSKENIATCFRVSLQKGNVGLARSIVSLYDAYEELFVAALEEEMKRLKMLQGEIIQVESTCEPVVKWGQNESHVFVSMKMSHRWDSPPCLNTKQENSALTNSTFEYTNVCVVSHSKITFRFAILFYDLVEDVPISVHRDGVGIYSAIIRKYQSKVWPFLTRDEKSYQTWAEISERHNAVHNQYLSLLDSILRARRSKPVVMDEEIEGQEKKGEEQVLISSDEDKSSVQGSENNQKISQSVQVDQNPIEEGNES